MTRARCGPRERGPEAGRSASALLLVDFINALDFEHGPELRAPAEAAAARTADLKRRAKDAGWPVIYANDNFGHWRSDFSRIVDECARPESRGTNLARQLRPEPDDYSVLKPRHSAFFGSPLEFVLAELGVQRLVITGLVTEMCVLFTAHDAYVRQYALWVPGDCVASVDAADHRRTLDHLAEVLGADTRPSDDAAAFGAAPADESRERRRAAG